MMSIGTALTGVLMGAEAKGHAKKYTTQQREKRIGSVPPGGIPPMKKISARRALDFYLQKQAGKEVATMGHALKALGWGAGFAAGGALAGTAARSVGGVYQHFQSNRMYEELKRRYPEVRRHAKAREYFDLIIAYAPSLMRHPAAIGDFLRRQLDYPMSSIEFIKQLADLEATVSKTESSSAAARFGDTIGNSAGMIGVFTPEAPKK